MYALDLYRETVLENATVNRIEPFDLKVLESVWENLFPLTIIKDNNSVYLSC